MNDIFDIQYNIGDKSIKLVRGDITELDADAIVNAANERLEHGGGVAGAIVRKGGRDIQEESYAWIKAHGRVKTGDAVATGAGRLEAKYVIHAVGPVMGSGDEDAKLLSATVKSLELANDLNLHSIAFPAISTGIFGFPVERCAKIMMRAAKEHLAESNLCEIVFCLWDEHSFNTFKSELHDSNS